MREPSDVLTSWLGLRTISFDHKPREALHHFSCLFGGVRSTLTVHLVRPDEVVASGKHFVHSFGIAHEDMDIARRHECPNWSIAKVRARFVLEVPPSAGVTRPGRQQARDRELVYDLPNVWFKDLEKNVERIDG
jgi:hypothetical protein